MADRKITDLTALAAGSQATGDLLTIVDVSESAAADKNKSITVESLFKGIPGDVGIGTSSPGRTLSVDGSIQVSNSTSGFGLGEGFEILHESGGSTYLLNRENAETRFYTNNTEQMRIDSSGNVGIGTSSPTSRIHALNGASDNPHFYFKSTVSTGDNNSGDLFKIEHSRGVGFDNALLNVLNSAGSVLYVEGTGKVGIGTDSPVQQSGTGLHIHNASGQARLKITNNTVGATADDGTDFIAEASTDFHILNHENGALKLGTNDAEQMRIDSSGNVGIGTTSPSNNLDILSTTSGTTVSARVGSTATSGVNNANLIINNGGTGNATLRFDYESSTNRASIGVPQSTQALFFTTAGSERMRIDSSGRVQVASTGNTGANLFVAGGSGQSAGTEVDIARFFASTASSTNSGGLTIGGVWHNTDVNQRIAYLQSEQGNNPGSTARRLALNPSGGNVGIGTKSPNHKLTLATTSTSTFDAFNISSGNTSSTGYQIGVDSSGNVFHWNTTNSVINFATNNTERTRIDSSGNILVGKTTTSTGTDGIVLGAGGLFTATRSNSYVALFNRGADDGQVIGILQNNSTEGTISVSGSTVSYNGGHLSRWSQLAGNAERIEILRGSVLSNLDEMCEWGEENNEQLNRMKVSDVEGDVNASGVFQCWDDDDDTYTNDFFCAMTGDFVIRIAQGTTVARGDLLMSAGDGTAKPQDDDIVRSKTIAKVTSTTVSTTYADGSYCVPCVLMAC